LSNTPIAQIDRSDNPNRLVDPGDEAVSWESSGIIDVSSLYGPGAWLVDVQAHTLDVPQFGDTDEGGQLLLIRQITSSPATPVATESPLPTDTATATAEVSPPTEPTEEPTTEPASPPASASA
jgi:hypothetical protein